MSKFSTKEWVAQEKLIFESMRSPLAERRERGIPQYVGVYVGPLLRTLKRYAIEDGIAEEVTQETLWAAINKLLAGHFTEHTNRSSYGWLVAIGRNKLKTVHRSRSRESERIRLWLAHDTAPALSPEDRIIYKDRLKRSLGRLPPAQRDAITKLLITRICDAQERLNLRANLSRALSNLKRLLSEEEPENVKQTN